MATTSSGSENALGRAIFIVDDDDDVRDMLADLLREEGFDVITANNGLDALASLRRAEFRPRLILLDLTMPVMNGFEFLEQHRLDPSLSLIPVAVITGKGSFTEEQKAALHAIVFTKPLQLEPLMDTIRRLC